MLEQIELRLGGLIHIDHDIVGLHEDKSELFGIQTAVNGLHGPVRCDLLQEGQRFTQDLGLAIQQDRQLINDLPVQVAASRHHDEHRGGVRHLGAQRFHPMATPAGNVQSNRQLRKKRSVVVGVRHAATLATLAPLQRDNLVILLSHDKIVTSLTPCASRRGPDERLNLIKMTGLS